MPFQTHMGSKQLHIKERLKGQTVLLNFIKYIDECNVFLTKPKGL